MRAKSADIVGVKDRLKGWICMLRLAQQLHDSWLVDRVMPNCTWGIY